MQRQEAREHETDRSLASDQDGVPAQEGQSLDCFEDGVDWLEHCAFKEGILLRNFYDPGENPGHHAHVLGVPAASGFEAGSNPGALVLCALRKGAMGTVVALKTRHVMVQRHPLANLEASGLRASPNNHTRRLMPKNTRRRNGAILDFFDVGRANAADGHFHQQFTGADAWDRDVFEAQIVWAAIHDGAHGFGQGKHRGVLTTACMDGTDFLVCVQRCPSAVSRLKNSFSSAPEETQLRRMQGVVGEDQPDALLIG